MPRNAGRRTFSSKEDGKKSDDSVSADTAEAAGDEAAAVDPTTALKEEIESLKKSLTYAIAERENVRRIMQRDIDSAREYGMRGFAEALLDVADNMQRALDASKVEAETNEAVKALYVGVQMTENQLMGAFEKVGIKRFDPLGDKFNPDLHMALMKTDANEHASEPGQVSTVIKTGFHIKDQLLRPAEVGVVKDA